jgi:hypothetical protein
MGIGSISMLSGIRCHRADSACVALGESLDITKTLPLSMLNPR